MTTSPLVVASTLACNMMPAGSKTSHSCGMAQRKETTHKVIRA